MPSIRTVLLISSLLLAGIAGLGVAPVAAGPSVTFVSSTATGASGDVVELGLELDGTQQATLAIGSGDEQLRYRVVDGDSDGRVRLRLNTHLAASDALSAEGVFDSATHRSGTHDFDPGNYDLAVTSGTPTPSDNVTADDLSTLYLGERGVENVTVSRTYRRLDDYSWGYGADLTDHFRVRESRRHPEEVVANGTLSMATNETLVFGIEAPGVGGAYAEGEGSPAARLLAALDAADLSIDAAVSGEREATNATLSGGELLASPATRVVAEPDRSRYYLVVDTAELGRSFAGWGVEPLSPGDTFTLSVREASSRGEKRTTSSATAVSARVVEKELRLGTGGGESPLVVAEGQRDWIRGSTSLARETPLRVSMLGDENRSTSVRVGRNGTLRIPVPSRWNDVERIRVTTLDGERTFADRALTFRSLDGAVEFESQRGGGDAVLVSDVRTSQASILAIYRKDSKERPLGTAWVSANHTGRVLVSVDGNVSLRGTETLVAVLYADLDDDMRLGREDSPVVVDGSVVSDEATYEVTTPPDRSETATEVADDPTETLGQFHSDRRSPARSTTGTDSPGFGAAVGALALTLSALSLRRRRR